MNRMCRAISPIGGCLAASCIALAAIGAASAQADEAEQILKAAGVKGGLIVHVGCGNGRLTAALRVGDQCVVHALDADPADVAEARAHIHSRGFYGQVSVEQWSKTHLPYMDNLVSLLVADDLGGVPMAEAMRVLQPNGVAYVRSGDAWTRTVKPWPEDIGEWTHYLQDATGNAVAADTRVGPARLMQWVAGPLYCRSHEIDTSVCAIVSAHGRIFYILDEGLTGITDERLPETWSLVARDAFNGVLLWKRPVPRWGWPEWKRAILAGKDWTGLRGQRTRSPITLPRRLVAVDDRVYVTLGYDAPATAIDAATGQIVRTYEKTKGADEILVSDGTVVVAVREEPTVARKPPPKKKGRRPTGQPAPAHILAIDAKTGRVLWNKPMARLLPLSLAVAGGRVVFHDHRAIVCFDLKTGSQLWRSPNHALGGNGWSSPYTLVARDDVVLLLGPKHLVALAADTGKTLWQGRGGRGPGVSNPPDLFVADGLVWYGGLEGKHDRRTTRVKKTGYDLKTGQAARTVDVAKLISPQHHFRCYRSKATERYLLWPKRGVEFVDLKGSDHMRHDWLRPPCKFGVMPCNGLLYIAPNQCFCYPGVKLNGFNAMASRLQSDRDESAASSDQRLERGPAYNATPTATPPCRASDWPTYRHDAKRSGSTSSDVPPRMVRLWQAELGGKITQPVIVGANVFAASVDAHRVWCLDARDGKPRWNYTAGGRVDSPPTVHKGLVLFGAADGWVTCLRASDGERVWRFRAAPQDRRIVAFGQVESAWPVNGTVLVKDGVAYVSAGRSSYLDGGIYLYGLDPKTGKVLHEGRADGPHPDPTQDVGRPFDMDGTLADVLVTDGSLIYMRQAVFDGRLAEQEAPRLSVMGDRRTGRRLVATGGLLDDSGWNRTFWMYAERWPGFYIANQSPKAGQILSFDKTATYGVKCFTRRNRHSPMFFPGKEGYLLFADDNETEPVLVDKDGKPKPVKWLPDTNKAIGWGLETPAVDKDKGTGFTRTRPPKWAGWVPIRVRAMVLAGKTLFIAGPPDVLDPKDPLAAFQGRKGAHLWAVSAADGKKLAEYKLDTPPVFDGMVAANGRLFLSTQDGRLTCMGKGS